MIAYFVHQGSIVSHCDLYLDTGEDVIIVST